MTRNNPRKLTKIENPPETGHRNRYATPACLHCATTPRVNIWQPPPLKNHGTRDHQETSQTLQPALTPATVMTDSAASCYHLERMSDSHHRSVQHSTHSTGSLPVGTAGFGGGGSAGRYRAADPAAFSHTFAPLSHRTPCPPLRPAACADAARRRRPRPPVTDGRGRGRRDHPPLGRPPGHAGGRTRQASVGTSP